MAMQAERVPTPILNYVRNLADHKGWRRQGNYAIWCGSRARNEPPYLLHEFVDGAVIAVTRIGPEPVLHRIAGGVPHHVSHLFGFWHIADCDAVWLETAHQDSLYYSILLGGVTGRPSRNECLWVCPKCGALMARSAFDTARHGFEAFLPFALERVRTFNADIALRTCPACGAVHPPSYGFDADRDEPIERAARDRG